MKKLFALLILVAAAFQLQAQTVIIDPPPSSPVAPPPPPPGSQPDTSGQVFQFAEKVASFPGGEAAFFKYIRDNIKYPKEEKDASKQGTVYVSFVVEKDGSITNVETLKGVPGAPGLSKEAERVIASMPKWIPGEMNGKPVRLQMTQPIKFVLQDNSPPEKTLCGSTLKPEMGSVYDFLTGRKPEFNGGDKALQDYVKQEMLKQKKLYESLSGKTIHISFIVDKDGQVCNVYGVNNPVADANAELVAGQIFCAMPAWIPGGYGIYGTSNSRNLNIRMTADVFLGEYEKGKMKTPPQITVKALGPPPPPPPPPTYKPGTEAKVTVQNASDSDAVFMWTEVSPEFPGGQAAFFKYLQDSIHYPAEEAKAGKQGTVYVSFVIEKDGRVTNVKIMKGVVDAPGLSQEAQRVIQSMPNWSPGKTVRTSVTQPVKFVLPEPK